MNPLHAFWLWLTARPAPSAPEAAPEIPLHQRTEIAWVLLRENPDDATATLAARAGVHQTTVSRMRRAMRTFPRAAASGLSWRGMRKLVRTSPSTT